MRFEKTVAILKLARALASNAEGLTLEEMAIKTAASRRTVERMRDAVEQAFGPLDRLEDGRKIRFRMTARGLGNFANAPTSEELAELESAARAFEAAQDPARAETLRSLESKIRASLREAERLRLETDIEARLDAEAFARRVGPRPLTDPRVLTALREALLAGMMVKFIYGGEYGEAPRWRKVIPYGVLFAPRYYLVAGIRSRPKPALYRLDRIHDIEVTDEPGARPKAFDLNAYASRSFGVFQEEPMDVTLRFSPSSAVDARAYLFHPTQEMTDEIDGSLTVRFRAGGLLQIVHHLMTWGPTVSILSPDKLQELMWEEVSALHKHYCHPRGHSRKVIQK